MRSADLPAGVYGRLGALVERLEEGPAGGGDAGGVPGDAARRRRTERHLHPHRRLGQGQRLRQRLQRRPLLLVRTDAQPLRPGAAPPPGRQHRNAPFFMFLYFVSRLGFNQVWIG